MTTIPGLFVLGEANFSDHGANRLGRLRAHAGPGRRLLRPPVHDRRLPRRATQLDTVDADAPGVRARPRPRSRRPDRRAARRSTARAPVDSFHRELGKLMWEHCGMARTEAGLERRSTEIPAAARGVLARTSRCPGRRASSTSRSRRPAGSPTSSSSASCMCLDALHREESLRRPLPRGVPDARGRGPARRRELRLRRGLGVHRRRPAPVLHKEPLDVRVRPPRRNGATSEH